MGKPKELDTEKITRLEIIDHMTDGLGRAFIKWHNNMQVEFELQDNKRTLKIFLSERKKDNG